MVLRMNFYNKRVKPAFARRMVVSAVLSLCAGAAHAVDPFVIKDIRIEGVQRMEPGTVFSYLPVRVGDTFSDDKGTDAIRALYATGFFKDVRIETEGNLLVVQLQERPAIAEVDFSGIREFNKEQLGKALKDVGVGESRIFDQSLVSRAEQELKRQYLSRGMYAAKVVTTVTPLERNRVVVNFTVEEGEVAKIRRIDFVGNKVFSDDVLLDEIKSSTPGWFTWYTRSDRYSRQKLAGDIEAIRSFYLDRGYLEMQVESTQVSISPDKQDIYLTLNISEGNKYTVSDVRLEGEMLGMEKELRDMVKIGPGDTYAGSVLTQSTKQISEHMGNFGYAFANVNVLPKVDREKKEVALTLMVDPGRRVYVRKINISGNTKTRDEVVRREFRQYENSWYDGQRIKTSRDRVDRLGYFKQVTLDTPEVPGTSDQVDLNMVVEEKPTGNIMLGAGFSKEDKLSISGAISQENIFGSGNTLSAEFNTSKRYRTIALSQTNPYFTDDGVSRTYELYLRTLRPSVYATGDYKVQTLGGAVNFGVPFSEVDRVYFGIGAEQTKVDTYANSPNMYTQYVKDYGDTAALKESGIGNVKTMAYPATIAWQRDSRDSALVPSQGRYQRVFGEVSAVGNLRYYRMTYQHQYFQPLFNNFATLAMNGEVNYGRGLNGKPYPIFKNYYAGGIGSVRGYEGGSLGTAKDQYGDSLGGAARVIASMELQFPFPGSGKDRTLRWFTFVDGGNVFAEKHKIKLNEMRYSAGIGLSWISPVGPLKLSYGRPLNAKPGDRSENFQFQIGTGF